MILREREVSNFFLRHHTISVLAIWVRSPNQFRLPEFSQAEVDYNRLQPLHRLIPGLRDSPCCGRKKISKCKLSFRWSSHTLTTHWRDSKLKSPFLKRDNVQWRKPKGFATTTTFFWSARLKQPFLDLVTTKSVTSRCCQCPPSNASESTIDPFGVKFAWLSDLIIDIYIQASESSFNFHPERQFGWLQRGRGGFHDGNY